MCCTLPILSPSFPFPLIFNFVEKIKNLEIFFVFATLALKWEKAISYHFACRFDGRTNLSNEVYNQVKERFKGKVFTTIIRENVRRVSLAFGPGA